MSETFVYRVIRGGDMLRGGKADDLVVPDGWRQVGEADTVDWRWYIVVRKPKRWNWLMRCLPCLHQWERIAWEEDAMRSNIRPHRMLCVKCGCKGERETEMSREPGRDW